MDSEVIETLRDSRSLRYTAPLRKSPPPCAAVDRRPPWNVAAPLVSVVMVTHGGGETALGAIEALIENTMRRSSSSSWTTPPPTERRRCCGSVSWARRSWQTRTTSGSRRASNQGAALRSGRYLCFLNPDAFVQPGWLPPLLTSVRARRVGRRRRAAVPASGRPCPGGRLGRGLRRRGALDRGRRRSERVRASLPAHRSTTAPPPASSYGPTSSAKSAASTRLHARVLRGRRPLLQARTSAASTVFEPGSRVVHLRGGSSPQARRLMRSTGGSSPSAGRSASNAGVRSAPTRRTRASSWPTATPRHSSESSSSTTGCRTTTAAPATRGWRRCLPSSSTSGQTRGSQFSAAIPKNAERYAAPLLERGIEVALADKRFDLWLERRRYHYSVVLRQPGRRTSIASNSELRRTQPQARRIYDIEALAFRRYEGQTTSGPDAARAGAQGSRAPTSSSASPRKRRRSPRKLTSACPRAPDLRRTCWSAPPGFDERTGVAFFGGFLAGPGGPNEDAAVRLVEDVMPHLWEGCPGSGSRSSARIRRQSFGSSRARSSTWSASCPIRSNASPARASTSIHFAIGAGIKLKLIDTMAAGLPFVTTPTGAEGLGLGDLEDVLVADVRPSSRGSRSISIATPSCGARPGGLLELRRGALRAGGVPPDVDRGVRAGRSRAAARPRSQRRGLRTKKAKSLGRTRSATRTSSSSDIRSSSATSFGSSSSKFAAMSASRN